MLRFVFFSSPETAGCMFRRFWKTVLHNLTRSCMRLGRFNRYLEFLFFHFDFHGDFSPFVLVVVVGVCIVVVEQVEKGKRELMRVVFRGGTCLGLR